jgi:DNA invertase Pin-like site-specific DNA recombinase
VKIAYSYVRFSSLKQQQGESLDRQLKGARAYAAAHGLQLDESTYRDLGVSGFRGKNFKSGALAAFIAAVQSGRIKPGVWLLIEQFDRLTRSDLDTAHQLFRQLLLLDVTIVTLVDGKVWTRESLKNMPDLVMSILLMARSHEESKAKSDRLKDVWGVKKAAAAADGTVISGSCPRWLKARADRSGYEVVEPMAQSVRRVYQHWIAGMGSGAICSLANREKWPHPGNGTGLGWQPSLVKRLLLSRAVLGEYQPHFNPDDDHTQRRPDGDPVPGYYPVIIDETTFLRAQAVRGRAGQFPGRRDGGYKNWLARLLECSCGHSITRHDKAGTKGRGTVRYYCSGRVRKLTQCEGVSAYELESAILNAVVHVIPVQLHSDQRAAELAAAVDAAEARRVEVLAAQGRLVLAVTLATSPLPAIVAELEAVAVKLKTLEFELSRARAELADVPGDTQGLFSAVYRVVTAGDVESRAALQVSIARVVEKFVVDIKGGYITARLRGATEPVRFTYRHGAVLPGAEDDR